MSSSKRCGRTDAETCMDIPGQSLPFAAPVFTHPGALTGGRGGLGLPLNLVALIVSKLDDLGDVSRLCRTSKLLYYMTLPKLYQTVTLRSYAEIRRVNGRVEGLGGASPICMALGALATSQCASVVKDLHFKGHWVEGDEYMYGRIPDSTMLLSIAIRAAIDKLLSMQSLTWELDVKPARLVYQGLTLRPSLTSLTLDFPISRTPRPVTVIPPITSLLYLSVRNIDPLCYNDDISHLLAGSTNLQELKMHWNPRMRLEAEASANLSTYFGLIIQSGRKLSVKKLGMQNFYGPNHGQLHATLDNTTAISTHFLDMFGGAHSNRTNVFVDETWRRVPPDGHFRWKIHRTNEFAPQHARILKGFKGLVELYLPSKTVGILPAPVDSPNVQNTGSPTSPTSPVSAGSPGSVGTHRSAVTNASRALSQDPGIMPGAYLENLCNDYVDAILSSHGATLKTLLLFDKFGLNETQVADIAKRAPLIEHIGLALDGSEEVFRILIPSMTNLRSLRILDNDLIRRLGMFEEKTLSEVCKEFGRQIYKSGNEKLRWLGIGDLTFHVEPPSKLSGRDGKEEWRCPLVQAASQDVQHLGIWSLDSLEL